MTTPIHQESAKIYQFPRRREQGKPSSDLLKLSADLQSTESHVDFGSGWYHEAAVREANPARKP